MLETDSEEAVVRAGGEVVDVEVSNTILIHGPYAIGLEAVQALVESVPGESNQSVSDLDVCKLPVSGDADVRASPVCLGCADLLVAVAGGVGAKLWDDPVPEVGEGGRILVGVEVGVYQNGSDGVVSDFDIGIEVAVNGSLGDFLAAQKFAGTCVAALHDGFVVSSDPASLVSHGRLGQEAGEKEADDVLLHFHGVDG